MPPLVSVITPTWQRNDLLLSRCIPSVQAQTYPAVEHIVVSDGPDGELAAHVPPGVTYAELPGHDPAVRWGLRARLHGIEMATGDLIAYLDDDDAWRPDHLTLVAGALTLDPAAGVAWGRAAVHFPGGGEATLGGAPHWGRVSTSMIVHRRELTSVATWEDTELPDWTLVASFLAQRAGYVAVDAVTCDYYRSRATEAPVAVLTRDSYQAWAQHKVFQQ